MAKYLPVLVALPILLVGGVVLADSHLTSEQQLGQQLLDFLDSLGAGWAVLAIFAVRQVAEVVAKLIPDNATGFLGLLRKAFKILAIYVPNKS